MEIRLEQYVSPSKAKEIIAELIGTSTDDVFDLMTEYGNNNATFGIDVTEGDKRFVPSLYIFGSGPKAEFLTDRLKELEFIKRLAARLNQDLLTDDFTSDSPFQWLIIKPSGQVLTVTEAEDHDDENPHLREDLARPFEPVSA